MIEVFKPWISLSNSLDVFKAVRNKELSGTSSYVKKFEEEFSNLHEDMFSVAVSNGSVALDLVLNSLNLKEKDEVIIPSLTIVSCLAALSRTDAKPVFCDVDFDSWNMTLDMVKEKVTENTKAIIAVHTYGLPCDILKIAEYCQNNNIILIEDTAESHGMVVNGKRCGTFGDYSTFSFYANKHITSGEGGMILTRHNEKYKQFLQMRNLDFSRNQRFKTENFYWNARIGGLQASLGYSQLKHQNLKRVIEKKRQQGIIYNKLLKNYQKYFYLPQEESYGVSNHYWIYGLVLKKDGLRDKLLELMVKDNIECRPFFWPLHLQPAYKKIYNSRSKLNSSEYLGKNGFYIPLGSHLTKQKQKHVVEKIIFNIEFLLSDANI